jgi:hypothetical protein
LLLWLFRHWRIRDPLIATLILLGTTITTRIVFFSFLSATWWRDGYERYLVPVMPLTSVFFVLMIYQTVVVWRRDHTETAASA